MDQGTQSPEADENTRDSGELVQQAMDLLIACLLSNVDLLVHFYGYKNLDEWLFGIILKTEVAKIREATAAGITRLCRRVTDQCVSLRCYHIHTQH